MAAWWLVGQLDTGRLGYGLLLAALLLAVIVLIPATIAAHPAVQHARAARSAAEPAASWPCPPMWLRRLGPFTAEMRSRPPLLVGLGAAVLLFVLFAAGTLNVLSAHTDHAYLGFDFFGFPRCGLALRFGTNPFTASETYQNYGPWATTWVTQPTACILAVPLSYLPPWTAFWTFNTFNLLLHLGIITVFGLRLSRRSFWEQPRLGRVRDLMFFALIGLFVPWYVLYFMAQYHSFSVLALTLVLAGSEYVAAGFVISALSKPVLAPAALVLVARRRWRQLLIISFFVAVGFLPWMFLRYDVAHGLTFGKNEAFSFFLTNSQSDTKFSVYRWNQQISLSAALDEIMPAARHLYIRYALAAAAIGAGAILFLRKRFGVAIIATMLWFFFLYGRGHEYHLTLYVPMLLYLYVGRDGRYRGWPLVLITVVLALPTAYPLFRLLYGYPMPDGLSNVVMLHDNRALYYAFLWQKPLAAFLLLGLLLVKEWPYTRPAAEEPDEERRAEPAQPERELQPGAVGS